MSGGSYDYVFSKLRNECVGRMYDDEMNDLIIDLEEVLHDLEWWQSGDYSEDSYRETLRKFKAKWFQADREERIKGYIDAELEQCRKSLYSLIGVGPRNKGVEEKWQKRDLRTASGTRNRRTERSV